MTYLLWLIANLVGLWLTVSLLILFMAGRYPRSISPESALLVPAFVLLADVLLVLLR